MQTLERDEAAVILHAAATVYRPGDVVRMDPYWEADSLDAFSTELFGVPVAQMLSFSAEQLIEDWREAGQRAVSS